MDSTKLSFFTWLKNIFCKIQKCVKAFLVRETRGGKKSNLKKSRESPKKFKKVPKFLRHLWDVSKRLHKIENEKNRRPSLVEDPKTPSLLHFCAISKNVQDFENRRFSVQKSPYNFVQRILFSNSIPVVEACRKKEKKNSRLEKIFF